MLNMHRQIMPTRTLRSSVYIYIYIYSLLALIYELHLYNILECRKSSTPTQLFFHSVGDTATPHSMHYRSANQYTYARDSFH